MPVPAIITLPRLPWGPGLFLLGDLFKRQGRYEEYADEASKGTRRTLRLDLPEGSVVYRDLWLAEHSGIYVGDGVFVSKQKNGDVIGQWLNDFLGKATSFFVSADNALRPLGGPEIARRAKAAVGTYRNYGKSPSRDDGSYDLRKNNCHIFSSYCITGKRNNDTGLSHLKPTAKQHAHMTKWVGWRFDS